MLVFEVIPVLGMRRQCVVTILARDHPESVTKIRILPQAKHDCCSRSNVWVYEDVWNTT